MVVLGGGVIEAMGDSLLDPIRRAAARYALPTTMDGVQIVEATLGDNAGVIGASVLARQRLSCNAILAFDFCLFRQELRINFEN